MLRSTAIFVRSAWSSARRIIFNIASFTREWLWQILIAAVVVAFIFFVIRPFDDDPNIDAVSVASAWGESISRLGIQPVFPPDEDIYVGDIWAVIVNSRDNSLLNQSVRVGHIDLRREIISARQDRPLFPVTPRRLADEKYRPLSRLEEDNHPNDSTKIALTLSAFPGISITHTKKKSGFFGAVFGGISAGRDERESEEIRIPVAETYGAPARLTLQRMNEWCKIKSHEAYCKGEDAIRRLLAYAVNPSVLKRTNGKYESEVRLQVITRIFLMREIEHRRGMSSSASAAVQTGSKPPNPTSNAQPASGAAPNSDPPAQAIRQPEAGSASMGHISMSQGNNSGLSLIEVFQRPLVFGYRAVTFDLSGSTNSTAEESP